MFLLVAVLFTWVSVNLWRVQGFDLDLVIVGTYLTTALAYWGALEFATKTVGEVSVLRIRTNGETFEFVTVDGDGLATVASVLTDRAL